MKSELLLFRLATVELIRHNVGSSSVARIQVAAVSLEEVFNEIAFRSTLNSNLFYDAIKMMMIFSPFSSLSVPIVYSDSVGRITGTEAVLTCSAFPAYFISSSCTSRWLIVHSSLSSLPTFTIHSPHFPFCFMILSVGLMKI